MTPTGESCLSVCQTHQNGRKISPDFYTIRKVIFGLVREKCLTDKRSEKMIYRIDASIDDLDEKMTYRSVSLDLLGLTVV